MMSVKMDFKIKNGNIKFKKWEKNLFILLS